MTEDKVQLIITFDNPHSAVFTLETTGEIDPYQLLMLANFLEFEGKYALSRIRNVQEMQLAQQLEEQKKISIARPNILKPQ